MQIGHCTLPGLDRLARIIAAMLKPGDLIILHGEIGAGKTAFAKRLIGAILKDPAADIPSPAFAIQQIYETERFRVSHFDFYRFHDPGEATELGLTDVAGTDVVIAEWADRGALPALAHRLDVAFAETTDPDARGISLTGHGRWEKLLERVAAIYAFLGEGPWQRATIEPHTGDASARVYYRLWLDGSTALLMDWPRQADGPPVRDGKPYSQIAHLAEGVVPFVAVAAALRDADLKVPEIYQQDLQAGLLIIEDFGDDVFQSMARSGSDMRPCIKLAVDALLKLRRKSPPLSITAGAATHTLPGYDRQALEIETELLLDWYVPFASGMTATVEDRKDFSFLWGEQFGWLLGEAAERRWVLRDFHSPNLLLTGTPEEPVLGVIDFQDALAGHAAYDLVSLLQDARIDLPAGAEGTMLGYYSRMAGGADPDFNPETFNRAYAVLGAQRSTKILGIFARLAMRDGKPAYLEHMPRVAAYLRKNLDHPTLLSLKAWYMRTLPGLFAAQPGFGD